jgi:ribosomal protein S27E
MTALRSDCLYVHCADCGHTWIGVYLPMAMDKFAKVLRKAACPKCAASGKSIVMASQDQAIAFERAQK